MKARDGRDRVPVDDRMAARRNIAATPDSDQKCALGVHATPSLLIIHASKQLQDSRVVHPALHAEGPLPYGRNHRLDAKGMDIRPLNAQAMQAGHGQNRRHALPVVPLLNPGGHISTDVLDNQVGSKVEQLHAKTERNAIKVQQAHEESLRLQTSNLEAKLEMQRSLAAHQTEVQNRFQTKRFDVYKLNALKQDKLKQEFARSRFTLNQLLTSNGPTVDPMNFRESTCTTDQFYNVECTETVTDK